MSGVAGSLGGLGLNDTPGNKPYRMGEVELQNDLAFYRDFL